MASYHPAPETTWGKLIAALAQVLAGMGAGTALADELITRLGATNARDVAVASVAGARHQALLTSFPTIASGIEESGAVEVKLGLLAALPLIAHQVAGTALRAADGPLRTDLEAIASDGAVLAIGALDSVGALMVVVTGDFSGGLHSFHIHNFRRRGTGARGAGAAKAEQLITSLMARAGDAARAGVTGARQVGFLAGFFAVAAELKVASALHKLGLLAHLVFMAIDSAGSGVRAINDALLA